MSPAKKSSTPSTVVTAEALQGRLRGHRPAEQLKSEELHRGRIITLDRDTVRLPDGVTSEMDILRHPGASAVVPFLSEHLWLVTHGPTQERNYR